MPWAVPVGARDPKPLRYPITSAIACVSRPRSFVFSPSRHVNYFTGQWSLVRMGPVCWLDYPLSPRSHGNPGIPRAGCFITSRVKLDQCSRAAEPAGLPEMHLCLGSAALFYPSLALPPNSQPGSLLPKAPSSSSLAERCRGYPGWGRPASGASSGCSLCQGASLVGAHAPALAARASSLIQEPAAVDPKPGAGERQSACFASAFCLSLQWHRQKIQIFSAL